MPAETREDAHSVALSSDEEAPRSSGNPARRLRPHESPISEGFLNGICVMLEKLAKGNPVPRWLSVFARSRRGCNVPIGDYVQRLARHCAAQEEDIVTAMMLIDRASYAHPACALSLATFHRLFLAAIVVSMKYRQDFHFANSYCAAVGGVSVEELNVLERQFLLCLDFDLYVEPEHYTEFCAALADYHSATTGHAPLSPPSLCHASGSQYHDEAIRAKLVAGPAPAEASPAFMPDYW